MKILALDSSGLVASVAVVENDVLISSYLNAKEDVLRIVNLVTSIIENEINKFINE